MPAHLSLAATLEPNGGRTTRAARRNASRLVDALCGWRILAERARVPGGGELDLAARRGRTLALVEVKQRASVDAAALSLDDHRLRRVAVAAERLALRFVRPADAMQIDAIFIVPGKLPRHLANVWCG